MPAANATLIDTGPLVAALAENDARHEECEAAFKELPAPLLTFWLLRALPNLRQQSVNAPSLAIRHLIAEKIKGVVCSAKSLVCQRTTHLRELSIANS